MKNVNVFLAEKKTISALLAPTKTSDKILKLDDHMMCAVAGKKFILNSLKDLMNPISKYPIMIK